MPIKINLMAEAQALEEARRRNPVKLGIWVAGFFIALVGLWIAKLQLDIHFANNDLAQLTKDWSDKEPKFKGVTEQKAAVGAIEAKISALDNLETNRFLWGSVLNALQHTVVDQIEVGHIWGAQTYEREPNKVVGTGKIPITIPGPASQKQIQSLLESDHKVTIQGAANFEKVKLSIAGRDFSPSAEGFKKYEDALNHYDFFAKTLGVRDGFTIEGAPGPKFPLSPGSTREYRSFTLTNQFPDIRRNDR